MIIEVTYSEQLDVRHRVRWVAVDGTLTNSSDKARYFNSVAAAGQFLGKIQDDCEAADLTIEAISIRPSIIRRYVAAEPL